MTEAPYVVSAREVRTLLRRLSGRHSGDGGVSSGYRRLPVMMLRGNRRDPPSGVVAGFAKRYGCRVLSLRGLGGRDFFDD